MYLFRMSVEVKRMEGTQLPADCSGACVGVYVRANDIKEAIDLAESELRNDKYLPFRTYEATEIDIEDLTEENEEYSEEGDPESKDLINIFSNGGVCMQILTYTHQKNMNYSKIFNKAFHSMPKATRFCHE
jgi:hypothetical protein